MLTLLLAVAAATAPAADPPARPNVVFFLLDDAGWGDAAAFGHPYLKTPNIDRLTRQGSRFGQFYVNNPVCSPSRTAFMTGHFPARHRIHQHLATAEQNAARGMPNWLDPTVPTLWRLLKDAGYTTGHFGKWHLAGGRLGPDPSAYGVDDHRSVVSSGPGWNELRSDPFFWAHSTGLFVDEAIRFIRGRGGRPFFVSIWTLVPHAELKPTPEQLAVYKDLNVDPADFPSWMRDYVARARDATAQARVYCASMTGLDTELGRLLDFLDAEKLAEETLFVFSSDNGPEDYLIRNASNAGMGSPGVFRARKRSIYEGGVRVPLVVRYPGKAPAGRFDESSVLSAVDFVPTVCKLAGVAAPGGLDGEDRSDVLLGGSRPRAKPLYWDWRGSVHNVPEYCPPRLAVREGKWKLYSQYDGSGVELYDVPADPEERTNLAAAEPAVVAELKAKLLAWRKTLPDGPVQPARPEPKRKPPAPAGRDKPA